MRSWVLLLLLAAFSAARLRPGSAESDTLPPSLVDLVRNSPIASVDDLKLLLQQETSAIEEEEDEHDVPTNATHGRYSRSLVEAEPAQQAACKVRTEVLEVTRSMLDRRNTNFMLWPSCVEVQRCSGCCNTRMLSCVPTVTSSRYLQVTKIQFINKKLHYDKAIISVEDHVSCRCQTASSASSSLPKPPPPPAQQTPPSPHRPAPLPRLPAVPKTQTSKADLHRHDDLKHNQQRLYPEEREPVARQWQQGSHPQLVHWAQPRLHQAAAHGTSGALGSVSSWPSEARAEHSIMGSVQQVGHGSGFEGSREDGGVRLEKSGGDVQHQDHAQRQQQHQHQRPQQRPGGGDDQPLRTQYRLNTPQSDSASPPGLPTQSPQLEPSPTLPLTTKQTDSVTSPKITAATSLRQTETETVSQRAGGGESGSASSGGSAAGELVPQGKDRDSKLSSGVELSNEDERRQKLLEMVQREPDKPLRPRHRQQRPKEKTSKTAPSTVAPASPSARKAPVHPASPRRRRKHRKRMSKAAMRAMIM